MLYTFTVLSIFNKLDSLLVRGYFIFLSKRYQGGEALRSWKEACSLWDSGYFLYSYILAIISINFLQYGIYHAVLAWVTLIWVIIMHSMVFAREIKEKLQNIAVLVYYGLIAIWFLGIVIFFFYNAFAD